MVRATLPSGPILTRRTALARLGAGGLAIGLVARAQATHAQESTPETVPSFLQEWKAGWESANPDRIASAYADDAVLDVVPFNITLPNKQAIHEYFTAYFRAFSEPTPRITLVFATPEHAGAEWTFKGTYFGQLQGLPPGHGQPVSIRGGNIMTLLGDQIVAERIYTDLAAILGQLGIIPPLSGTPAAATPVS